jgi:hypothetical protein
MSALPAVAADRPPQIVQIGSITTDQHGNPKTGRICINTREFAIQQLARGVDIDHDALLYFRD